MQIGLGLLVLAVWGTTLLRGLVPGGRDLLAGAPVRRGRRRARRPAAAPPRPATPRRARRRRSARGSDARRRVPARRGGRRSPSSTPTRTRRSPGCASASPCRGCRRSTAGSSPGATWRCSVMRDAGDVHGRRPALLHRAGRRAEHAHARRRDAPRATARRSPGRSGSTPCASASPRPVREETDRLLDAVADRGEAELRRELAGPLAGGDRHARARPARRRDGRGARLVRRDRRLGHRDHRGTRADGGRRARLRGAARGDGAGAARRAGAARCVAEAAGEAGGLGRDARSSPTPR